MNTQDIEVNIKINNIEDMYKYAKLQFEAFNKVEHRPSYNDGYIFNIDDPNDQMWFKQFIQMRFCEELAEAEEARSNDQHFMEELTDAFNFLLAATIDSKRAISPDIFSFILLRKHFKAICKAPDICFLLLEPCAFTTKPFNPNKGAPENFSIGSLRLTPRKAPIAKSTPSLLNHDFIISSFKISLISSCGIFLIIATTFFIIK